MSHVGGHRRLVCVAQSKANGQEPEMSERPPNTAEPLARGARKASATSTAILLMLQTLAPTERAVFVLREVFHLRYDEIAKAVDKSPAAVRQIAHRARARVAARRPRRVVSTAETRRTLEALQRALETGDPQSLLDQLGKPPSP
jgi:DNA-directed RNA polymerase specialized sigma24 family protein